MSLWILLKIFFEQLINIFWKDLRDSVNTQLHRWARKISFIYVCFLVLNIRLESGLLVTPCFLSQDISLENVSSMYELSEAFNAIPLRHACILFILEQFDKLSARPGYWSDFLIYCLYILWAFSYLYNVLIAVYKNLVIWFSTVVCACCFAKNVVDLKGNLDL